MSMPTPQEKERFVDLLMKLREFIRTEDDTVARSHAGALVDEVAKEE